MRIPMRSLVFASIAILFSVSPAFAKANVALHLAGTVVEKSSDGKFIVVPVESIHPKSGEEIRYTISASNIGDSAAHAFVPQGRIPEGTAFESGSSPVVASVRIEFSLDGGKTWSAKPTSVVKKPDGTTSVKPTDPALFTNIRWMNAKDLAPRSSTSFTYAVKVK